MGPPGYNTEAGELHSGQPDLNTGTKYPLDIFIPNWHIKLVRIKIWIKLWLRKPLNLLWSYQTA